MCKRAYLIIGLQVFDQSFDIGDSIMKVFRVRVNCLWGCKSCITVRKIKEKILMNDNTQEKVGLWKMYFFEECTDNKKNCGKKVQLCQGHNSNALIRVCFHTGLLPNTNLQLIPTR